MDKYRDFIANILDGYKGKWMHEPLKLLPVYNGDAAVCAYLRPITGDYRITLPQCSQLLSDWRRENPGIATGTFVITRERTEAWLDKHIIGRPDRILFLITGLDGRPLGHIGYSSFDFEAKACEVDAVLRGVGGVCPGLMEYSMKSLLYWGIHTLKLEKITLKVFSDNTHAIRFYERCGFSFVKLIPLVRIVLPDEEKWEICLTPPELPAERYYAEANYDGLKADSLGLKLKPTEAGTT